MNKPLGNKCWVVPDGYIPQITENDSGNLNGYISHECACILNTGPKDAQIDLTIYFEDSEPEYVKGLVVGAKRSCHLRMDQLKMNGQVVIERARPYSLIINSTEPIVVQMSRLDTTQSNMSFLSTMCFSVDDE